MRACLWLLLGVTGCGSVVVPVDEIGPTRPQSSGQALFSATDQTPGYFRDTYRLLEAQAALDDATAAHRLGIDLPARLADPGELPDLAALDAATLRGLQIVAWRAYQAAGSSARLARTLGETLLGRTLELDPARAAWNAAHPDQLVAITAGGAAPLAEEGLWAIAEAADGLPASCTVPVSTGTAFDPGEAEVVWVDEVCDPDRWVGAYCEPDRWIEGECYDTWVPESCSGGYWEDLGYYEYRCQSDGYCQYIWISRWEYFDGSCSGGYWDEVCYPGYWEYGLCYDGTFVPGYCEPGHYEYRYPGGTWTFVSNTEAPVQCTTVRPAQRAIAASVAQVLHALVLEELAPEWRSALAALVASGQLQAPTEATFDAVVQILAATAP